ncbi:alpha/beta hydrolase [Devosia riboflavina]|uniref:Alpha/beta hydrolase n=1 Tax=Devosia riboflavina TaxID=46914 RepID=A0A087LZ30_9HYPH|nr:alpha/beta hydrolase [Devosia riboflavina]KFL29883.1 alpha/beta hydrolase [Devosia riboflavina]
MSQAIESGYAPVEGTELYYEIHGEGAPLLMLHGGVNPSGFFGAPLAAMAGAFKVIAIHARGHGLSKDSDTPWSIEQAADDVAAVLRDRGIEKASVMGYSFGGKIAIQFAIRHPDMLEKLVIVSAGYARNGDYPEVRAAFEKMPDMADAIGGSIAQSPLAELYPDVDWVRVMRKSGQLGVRDYDWSEGVKTIKAPTLLVFADADSIRPEHVVDFYKLLGGGQRDAGLDGSLRSPSRLAIIPGVTHHTIIGAPAVFEHARAFLQG